MTVPEVEDAWADVVGQPDAVARLRAAVNDPVPAYIFVGPSGSGRMAAARAFAAELFARSATGDDAARHARLARHAKHPDVSVVLPEGARLSVKEAKGTVAEAARSPMEASHKVIVLPEFHRVEINGAILLKTIEDPPPSTVFIVIADEVVPDIVTIASRALRVDFGPVPAAAVAARLEAEGVAGATAADAARAAAGDLARARLLATDPELSARRALWADVPRRLDGTGAAAAVATEEVQAAIDAAQAPVDAGHDAEVAALEEETERYGLRKGGLTDLKTVQRREKRRLRALELRFGLATLAAAYRDRLSEARHPAPLIESLTAIQRATEALDRNPNEALLLDDLFVRLSPLPG